jgi:hypothetical protein
MPNTGYSYHWPRGSVSMLRDLSFQCPACGEGEWTVTLDSDGEVVGSPVIDCGAGTRCENCYVNGQHADALAAAIQAADRLEANGPTEEQLESMYDTAAPSAAERQHQLREARRMRQ